MKKPAEKRDREIIARDLLTIGRAAKALKVSRQAIWDAIDRGRLKAYRIGRMILITDAALEIYRRTRKHSGPKARNPQEKAKG